MNSDFTHLDAHGRASMVDITGKAETARRAVARCVVVGAGGPRAFGTDDEAAEVLGNARWAGIIGAGYTATLVPLCHPVPLTGIDVALTFEGDNVAISAVAETISRTGVEMEALTACAIAALSVVQRILPHRPEARVEDLTLWSKSGGRSGTWERDAGGMRSIAGTH